MYPSPPAAPPCPTSHHPLTLLRLHRRPALSMRAIEALGARALQARSGAVLGARQDRCLRDLSAMAAIHSGGLSQQDWHGRSAPGCRSWTLPLIAPDRKLEERSRTYSLRSSPAASPFPNRARSRLTSLKRKQRQFATRFFDWPVFASMTASTTVCAIGDESVYSPRDPPILSGCGPTRSVSTPG